MTLYLKSGLILIVVAVLSFNMYTAERNLNFAQKQCRSFELSKGEIGEGVLRYCDNGTEQELYVSGELDFRPTDRSEKNAADLIAIRKVIRDFKKRDKGVFRIVTNNAGGGETAWHYKLIMAVEDACVKDCRIITEIKGRCESACNQFHITCVKNARTILHKGAATCEHATTDEDNPACNRNDPNGSDEDDLCSTEVAVNEYKARCGVLTKGRNLNIDEDRKTEIYEFIDRLAKGGVFDTTRLTCTPITWADRDLTSGSGAGLSGKLFR